MASKIEAALGNRPQLGSEGLHVREGMQYNPQSTQHVDHYSDSIKRLIGVADWAKGEIQKEVEVDQSDFLLNNYTAEQRQKLSEQGVLLTQHNKKTVQNYYKKLGNLAAYEADRAVKALIEDGKITNRKELTETLMEIRKSTMQTYAQANGFDFNEQDFQLGFAANVVERDITLFDGLAVKTSNRLDSQIVTNSVSDIKRIVNDSEFGTPAVFPKVFSEYLTNSLSNESIPNPRMVREIGMQTLNDLVDADNGLPLLLSLKDYKVTLDGVTKSWRDHVGGDAWDTLENKARTKTTERSTGMLSQLQVDITASAGRPIEDAEKLLETYNQRFNRMYPEEHSNPARSILTNFAVHIQQRKNKEANDAKLEADKALVKQQNFLKYSDAIQRAKSGEIVDLNNLGLSKDEQIEFSQMILEKLENDPNMSPEQKVKEFASLLQVDHKNGAFRSQFDTLVGNAQSDIQAAVINGTWDEDKAQAFQRLTALYKVNAPLVTLLAPESADVIATMDLLDKYKVEPQSLIDQMKANKGLSQVDKEIRDRTWETQKQQSKNPLFSYMSGSTERAARVYFDSYFLKTGDEKAAFEATKQFLEATTFDVGKSSWFNINSRDRVGSIPKAQLMVTDDPNSWKEGGEILNEAIELIKFGKILGKDSLDDVKGSKPIGTQVIVTYTPQGINVLNLDTNYNKTFTQEDLRKAFMKKQEEALKVAEKVKKEKQDKFFNDYEDNRKNKPFDPNSSWGG
ncbi:protein inside capsid C [Pasteurella phage PHB01]|uniref:Protein inside capsid C n=1 Tax=Pasteurella phage PHB01 TaxID=2006930 RepID=A0A218M4G3_9CAUD|nr:internal virion protein [Pasteurella phage PHB01]ASD51049.1 protein inside capsid C [Pasteurella phage PHB01]